MRRTLLFAGILLTALLLSIAGCLVPTDRDIALQIEEKLRADYQPDTITVVVKRRNNFSSRLRSLDISMSGFTATSIPLLAAGDASNTIENALKGGMTARAQTSSEDDAGSGRKVRIDHMTVRCQNFSIASLPVREMDVVCEKMRVRVQGGNFHVLSAQPVVGSITLSEAGITKFLREQPLPIQDLQVKLTSDGCIITGQARKFILFPVEMRGQVTAREQAVLYLRNPKLRVLRVPFPRMLVSYIMRDINPLVDVNERVPMATRLTITGVTHLEGALQLHARLPLVAEAGAP